MAVTQLKRQKAVLKKGERFAPEDIAAFLDNQDLFRYRENDRYERGENPKITDRPRASQGAPDSRVRISYARTLVDTVSGYMFKPGLIRYRAADNAYQKRIDEIMRANRESLTTARLGRHAATFGVAYELHYADPMTKSPRFAVVDPWEIVPIWNYDLEPRLIAAIRRYPVGDDWNIDVYYEDAIHHLVQHGDNMGERAPEEPHYYGRVPLAVFWNSDDGGSDFDPVKDLIDEYDVLISDSLNEFNRFASAYLVLKGLAIDDESLEGAKRKRVLELLENGEASFLTKEIPSEFLSLATTLIRDEIHRQSHVPDLVENAGDRLSGVAIGKLLYGFENLCAGKESYFRIGLEDRLALLGAIIGKTESAPAEVSIEWGRNVPEDVLNDMQCFAGYADRGISTETLISRFAPFVKDPKKEMAAFQKEVADGLHPDLEASDMIARQLQDGTGTEGAGESQESPQAETVEDPKMRAKAIEMLRNVR